MQRETGTLRVSDVLRRMMYVMGPTFVVLALTFVLPHVNPYNPPQFDLRGPIAIFAYYLTLSGAGNIAPITATAIVLYLVSRPGLAMSRRVKEFVVLFLVVFVVMQAWTRTEVIAKKLAAQPRPVIAAHRARGRPIASGMTRNCGGSR